MVCHQKVVHHLYKQTRRVFIQLSMPKSLSPKGIWMLYVCVLFLGMGGGGQVMAKRSEIFASSA